LLMPQVSGRQCVSTTPLLRNPALTNDRAGPGRRRFRPSTF